MAKRTYRFLVLISTMVRCQNSVRTALKGRQLRVYHSTWTRSFYVGVTVRMIARYAFTYIPGEYPIIQLFEFLLFISKLI